MNQNDNSNKNTTHTELVLGGVFAGIAMIAAVTKAICLSISATSIAALAKDVSIIMVAVMILLIAAKNVLPKKDSLASFEERFSHAIDSWADTNSNMIINNVKDKDTTLYSIHMYTDTTNFYNSVPVSTSSGWFLRMPRISEANYTQANTQIFFHLNRGTFLAGLKLDKNEADSELNTIGMRLKDYIGSKFPNINSGYKESEKKIIISFKDPIYTEEDINNFIDVVNSMYQAYLVSSNRKETK